MNEEYEFQKAMERRDKESATDRYWHEINAVKDESLKRFYDMPFPTVVRRFDEIALLGSEYEHWIEREIGAYMLRLAQKRYELRTSKT